MNPHLQVPRQIPLSKISPKLREGRNPGDLSALAADIGERGLRHPVSVTRDGRLVIGARRLAACAMAGVDPVDCWQVASVPDVIAVIAWENADDLDSGDAKHHVPATIRALAYQDLAMRELEWWPRPAPGQGLGAGSGEHREQLTGALCGPGEAGFLSVQQYRQAHGLAAAAAGWGHGRGGAGRLTVPAARRRSAREALAQLDHRDTRMINAVYNRWQKDRPMADPTVKPLTPADVGPLIAVISGFTGAIGATGLPRQDVAGDQLDGLDGALSDLLRAADDYRKTIRRAR